MSAENPNERSLDELRQDIEHTRQRVRDDVSELGAKVSMDNLKHEAKNAVTKRAKSAARRARNTAHNAGQYMRYRGNQAVTVVKDDPVPIAMMAIGAAGLGWWLYNRRQQPEDYDAVDDHFWEAETQRDFDRHYDDLVYGFEHAPGGEIDTTSTAESDARQRMRDAKADGRERLQPTASSGRVRGAASRGRERLRHATASGRERLQHVASSGRNQARQAWHLAEENPLAAGAIALAVGAGIGALMPRTRRENRTLGPKRDALVDDIKSRADATFQAVAHGASEALETAREEVRERMQQHAFDADAGREAQEVTHEAKEAARDAARKGREAAREEAERRNAERDAQRRDATPGTLHGSGNGRPSSP